MKLVRRRFFSQGKETPVRLSRDLELVGTGGRRVRVERKEGEIKLNQRRGGFGDWTFVLPLEARYNFTFFVSILPSNYLTKIVTEGIAQRYNTFASGHILICDSYFD